MTQQMKMVVWGCAAVGIGSLITAVIPLFKGGRLNIVFLGAGVVFLAVAVANARRAKKQSDR